MDAFLAHPKVDAMARALPAGSDDRRVVRRRRRARGRCTSGPGRRARSPRGVVDDADRQVTEAWTGPQVAWQMARGRPGAFGGKILTSWPVWLGLSAIFFLGLVDLRRPVSVRTLDLLVLLSFGVSLAFFNRGEVFASASLAVPPLVYLARAHGVDRLPPRLAGRADAPALAGVAPRRGDAVPRRVPDRAERRAPANGDRRRLRRGDRRRSHPRRPGARTARCRSTAVGPARRHDRTGASASASRRTGAASRRTRAATRTGRSRTSRTSPPCLAFGWAGRWDDLPAAHADAIGARPPRAARPRARRPPARRRAPRRHARVRVGGVPVHDVRAAREHERRADARAPRLGLLARVVARRPEASATALAGWTKFASLLSCRSGSPTAPGCGPHPSLRFVAAFGVTTVLAFSILLLEPSLWSALETFWDRTTRFQLGRDSPFSVWGWGQYHAAGIPDLASLQTVVQVGDDRARRRRRRRPAGQGAARARRAHRRGAPRGPALADALVLPLPSLGAPVRAARAVRSSPRGRRARRRAVATAPTSPRSPPPASSSPSPSGSPSPGSCSATR